MAKVATNNMPAPLADYYSATIPFVRDAIRKFFPIKFSNEWLDSCIGSARHPRNEELLDKYFQAPNNLYLTRDGKALRSVLAAMTLEAFGKDYRDYASYLAMTEVIEDTTISWDDIWDQSEMRRGGPAMHIAYGLPAALNASVAAYDYAFHVFYKNIFGLDEVTNNKILHALTWDKLHLPVGQAEELYWTDHDINDVTEAQYLQETMSRCAFLSFRGPVKIAAILAGAEDDRVQAMAEYGEYLGLGYHLHGDNLNLSSPELGKVWAEDITTGRRTLLILHTLRSASPKDRQRLAEIINARTLDPALKEEAVSYLFKYGALEYCTKRAQELGEQANACIERAKLDGVHQARFNALTEFCCTGRRL